MTSTLNGMTSPESPRNFSIFFRPMPFGRLLLNYIPFPDAGYAPGPHVRLSLCLASYDGGSSKFHSLGRCPMPSTSTTMEETGRLKNVNDAA